MSDKPDILRLSTAGKTSETYTDPRGNTLTLNANSQTAVVISRKQGKLCDLSAADADRKLIEQTRLIETSVWQQIFSAPRYTAPPHFIASLCGVVEADTETITVKRPFWRTNPTVMSDPAGNKVELPSVYNKVGHKITRTSALAEVKDMTGTQLCMVDEKQARALDPKPSPYSHSFEATPGAIPNLCKKPDTLGK